MTSTDNPARVFFGAELRRKREGAGLTGKELADKLGCTPQWISTMESGRKISKQSSHDLDTYFGTDGQFHRMWKLANETELRTTLPPGFSEYAERERTAASVRVFSALLINGLFQTEGYARSVLSSVEQGSAADLLDKRMERQSILLRDTPPHVWLTLDESVLHRVIGSTEITREQLVFLLELSERPTVMLNVVPNRVGYHAGLGGSFTILGFNGSDAAYSESAGIGTLIERPDRVAPFVVRWDLLRGHTLPVEESRALIETALESL